jgi:hypothetical protein
MNPVERRSLQHADYITRKWTLALAAVSSEIGDVENSS